MEIVRRTSFGKQWGEGENPEEGMLTDETRRDYHPRGIDRGAVKLILQHPYIDDLVTNADQLQDLIDTSNQLTVPEAAKLFRQVAGEGESIIESIEQDIVRSTGFRINAAEVRTAVRFAREIENKSRHS